MTQNITNISDISSNYNKRYLNKNNEFVCDENNCDFKDENFWKLIKHKRVFHSIEEPFKCDYNGCEKTFKRKKNYVRHALYVHFSSLVPEKVCPIDSCGKTFKGKNLISHIRTIHSANYLICEWPGCDYKTRRGAPGLKKHQLVHKGERNHVCEWPGCDKRFKNKCYLKQHILAHKKERTYVCNWPGCESSFVYNTDLYKHRKEHKNPKIIDNTIRYNCDICDKSYKSTITLNYHKRYHLGKHFSCEWPECDFKAYDNYKLKRHQRVHKNERNFMCDWPECGKGF